MSESITEFIKKYGKPYDTETDDYDVGPFQKNFDNASKSSKIYNMHMYWTKQDPYVVKQFIEHYTKPGDIVLDAFCGTGMTGVAAMMCGRHAILTEISPACIHIARNYTTPIDPHILERAYYRLREKVEPEIRPLYKTMCHNCKNPDTQIANTILSDVLRCPRCNAEVLYAGSGRWVKMKRGEKFRKILCQNCGYEFTKAKAQFVGVEPIEIRVECPRCKTRGEKKAKPLDKEDWRRYINIEGGERFINKLGNEVLEEIKEGEGLEKIPPKEPPYWYPVDVKFPLGYNTRQPLKRGIIHPYQMFSRRNLIALTIIWHYVNEIENEKVRDKMKLVFTSIIYRVNLQYKWNVSEKGGMRMGTLYIPAMIKDMNTFNTFEDKSRDLFKAVSEMRLFRTTLSCIVKCDARQNNLPYNSIGYCFYDPPYGANINYSELNLMWEAWLGQFTNVSEEVIENEYQGKGREDYEQMMLDSLKEAYRVLKPGRWLTMVYSYSDPSMYRTIQNVAYKAGFIDEGEVLHVNSTMKTKSQMDSDRTQQRFLVINFKKPKSGERKVIEKTEDIEYDVIRVIQDFFAKHPGKTRDYIYDQVIKQLFTTVQIQKFDLDEILKNFFRKVGDEWYAPGTLVTRKKGNEELQGELFPGPPPLEHPEKEVILQLQDFLKKYKRVPYSELREFYLRKIGISLERNFDDIIKENFKVEEGKVRLPTPVEQTRMQDISVQYQIRVIRRFLDGKLDRIPQTEELSNWVEFCYQNEFYKEGTQIFNLLGEDRVELDRYKKLKKMAEVCRIKSE